MQLKDKVIVVTGGANGIGRAMCRRFSQESPRGIVVADIDAAAARQVADEINATALGCDVAVEAEIRKLVETAETTYGPIDVFCSNAGIAFRSEFDSLDDDWDRIWHVNVMAHIYAARAVLPSMLERGGGYLVQTASAAGLLTQVGSASYSVTKHGAVAFAEWLSVTYGNRGIRVSCLCPLGVATDMVTGTNSMSKYLQSTAIPPEQVAEAVAAGIESEDFLILPHPEVGEFFQRKASDYDRWLRGMRRFRESVVE